MEEIDDNEKSNQNIETRKLIQQPNSRTKKTVFLTNVVTTFSSTQYYKKIIIFYYYNCEPVLGSPNQNSLSKLT